MICRFLSSDFCVLYSVFYVFYPKTALIQQKSHFLTEIVLELDPVNSACSYFYFYLADFKGKIDYSLNSG